MTTLEFLCLYLLSLRFVGCFPHALSCLEFVCLRMRIVMPLQNDLEENQEWPQEPKLREIILRYHPWKCPAHCLLFSVHLTFLEGTFSSAIPFHWGHMQGADQDRQDVESLILGYLANLFFIVHRSSNIPSNHK